MSLLIYLAIAVWGLAVFLVISGTFRALNHFRSSPPFLDAPFALYPVSILKPVKGYEENLEANFESFFELDYPDYEILFSVASPSDESIPTIEQLIAKNPNVQARLIIGAEERGPNPKVNNLLKSYAEAKNDWLLISDSNVWVPKNYLKRLVGHIDSNTGIITAVVAGRGAKSLGGHLEATYLNTFYARWMILADRVGLSCVVGKSMLFRRSAANRFGGVATLARYLAEDYMAGEAMKMLGLSVVIMKDPVVQPIGEYSLSQFWSRHLRWGRIRKSQAPGAFYFEPFLGPICSGLIGAWSLAQISDLSGLGLFFTHIAIWGWCDLRLMRQLEKSPTSLRRISVWVLREMLHLPLWLQAATGNTVNWRGKKLRVLPGGILEST